MAELACTGWTRFSFDSALAGWARHADIAAMAAASDLANEDWVRCGGTWFVGVDALPNDEYGRLPGGPPLAGGAISAARAMNDAPLHRAQASMLYLGYPKQGADEDDAAFRFRARRDAAHVDGLHRIMPGRRRMLKERHAWLLGIPLNDCDAAPMTIWEGSHEIMRAALIKAYAGVPPADWATYDVTEAYQAARKRCFETLPRVEIRARVGEAYLMHRHALHGVAPWGDAAGERRAIAYFRPELTDGDNSDAWLTAP
jgi:hypothetical protein